MSSAAVFFSILGNALFTQQSTPAISRSFNVVQLPCRFALGVEDHRLRPASIPSSSGPATYQPYTSQRSLTIQCGHSSILAIECSNEFLLKIPKNPSISIKKSEKFQRIPDATRINLTESQDILKYLKISQIIP